MDAILQALLALAATLRTMRAEVEDAGGDVFTVTLASHAGYPLARHLRSEINHAVFAAARAGAQAYDFGVRGSLSVVIDGEWAKPITGTLHEYAAAEWGEARPSVWTTDYYVASWLSAVRHAQEDERAALLPEVLAELRSLAS